MFDTLQKRAWLDGFVEKLSETLFPCQGTGRTGMGLGRALRGPLGIPPGSEERKKRNMPNKKGPGKKQLERRKKDKERENDEKS